ncbi:L-threonine O-3-phosphate decarboxylase [Rhodothalassium salexigens DSM 2132]|uniref:threonine-phosphate decarboxylase n=1 Tax=Rhodothalassium salexigens DSM 2132 TaxID=1188247 RepID=A0A4R2PS09_RHOSA|nr:threonine-phosphate decarboxylase CobD [Rhodothalassium salexigens]MBB4210383.1 cobalamin biosynthetic protein CobC [Rhodothalassium salexigens DSM 2132]MBK1638584.1 threonine-phosphate decarboxylase [Rhodothalassium salexigens DSM 2132]TCP38547.1 L-threonine O-3-phosphate decarboxylase [Rhodothalassium salexigens DSM 2132]
MPDSAPPTAFDPAPPSLPPIRHGGDDAAAAAWPDAPRPLLDLSTGLNPRPYPVGTVAPDLWARLPQAANQVELLAAARRYLGLARHARLATAPGSQMLIGQLPHLVPPGPMAILGPTYGEHAPAWARAGHRVETVTGLDAARATGATTLLITNPNNPCGRVFSPHALRALLNAANGPRLLVVDEAFADLDPTNSLAPYCDHPGIIVLRSFGKFFGLGGLRLGLMAAAPVWVEAMSQRLGPWSVSGPALAIAARAYADTAWITATRARLHQDARRLDTLLTRAGFRVVGGTVLYRLVEHDDAAAWVDGLGRRGILVRRFDYQPRWLRFGLPGDEAQWHRLSTALKAAEPHRRSV